MDMEFEIFPPEKNDLIHQKDNETKPERWFETVCRSCLSNQDLSKMKEVVINNIDVFKMFEFITKEQLDNRISTQICKPCIDQLLPTHNFLKMIDQSNQVLQHAINKLDLSNSEACERNLIKDDAFSDESDVSPENYKEETMSSDDEVPLLEKFNIDIEVAKNNLNKRNASDKEIKEDLTSTDANYMSNYLVSLSGQCLICAKEVIHLNKHLRQIHNLDWETSTCLKCSYSNEDEVAFIKHHSECISNESQHNESLVKEEIIPEVVSQEESSNKDVKKKIKGRSKKGIMRSKKQKVSKFNCNECGDVVCKNYEEIYRHFKEWHSTKSDCILCDKKFANSLSLIYHMMVHHGKLKCCRLCLVSFTTSKELLKHYKSEEHNTKCTVCNEQFKNRKAVYEHRRKKHLNPQLENQKYKCPECPKEFANQNNIRRHILVFHNDVRFLCDTCGQSYTTNRNLQLHIMKFHEGQQVETKNNKKNFFCEACGRELKIFHKYAIALHRAKHKGHNYVCKKCFESFSLEEEFNNHVQQQGHELFECPICQSKFVREENLKIHLKNHDAPGWNKNYFAQQGKSSNLKNEKGELVCSYCPKVFKLKQRLDIHLRVHTNERPYKCHICQKSFKTWIHRKTHLNVHLGIKKWQCRYCQKAFTYSSTLKGHEMMHTGERPHLCPECKKGFISASALKKHRQTHLRTGTPNYEKKTYRNLKKEIEKNVNNDHEDNTEFLYKYGQIFVGSDASYESFSDPSKDQLQQPFQDFKK